MMKNTLDKDKNKDEEFPTREGAPEGLMIYNPDELIYQKLHACVYLRKVSDALHGEELEPPDSDNEY